MELSVERAAHRPPSPVPRGPGTPLAITVRPPVSVAVSVPVPWYQRGRADAVAVRALPVTDAQARRAAFGLPNLRRNICLHFFMTGRRGAIPIHAPHILKSLARQDSTICRCQLRGGVHLEQGYVGDVCLSARFNQCVFYEDELTGR
jgi:hypothetical protein